MTSPCNRKRRVLMFLVIVLIQVVAFHTIFSVCVIAGENAALSWEEKEALVEQGISQYHGGDLTAAKESFERAKSASSNNANVPYYLGRIYLEESQRPRAITEWRQYVRMAPDSEDSLKIRQYLTLLLREEAVAYAKQAVANEAAILRGPANDNTVAVTSFSNIGSDTLGPLGKGLAAMLISDLSQVPDLQVVERVRLQALLQEMDLGISGVVDPETVPKVGKLLKSKHVATGSLADSVEESLQLFSAVVDTEQADHIDTREAKGVLKEFFTLEKQIACGIIEDIGRDCDQMPAAFKKVHTRSLAALTSYSIGLDYLDQEKYDEAREQFQKAIDEDPEFDLAKESLAWTPLGSMLLMGSSQMISSLSTSMMSSTGAATATGGASSVATAGGISTGWLIGGGIAGAAAIAAAAGGGGGGSGGNPDPGPTPTPINVAGSWAGTWSSAGGTGGALSLVIVQDDESIGGQGTMTGSQCALSGTLTGTADESNLEGNISGTNGVMSISATCTTTSMNGTIEFKSGDCSGVSGSFSATPPGSATISW